MSPPAKSHSILRQADDSFAIRIIIFEPATARFAVAVT
jgi:hypothetical protein